MVKPGTKTCGKVEGKLSIGGKICQPKMSLACRLFSDEDNHRPKNSGRNFDPSLTA